MTTPTPILSLKDVTKILPSGGKPLTILDQVSLDIERGEFVAVVGRSGSGKSTLLGLMAGLDRPTRGSIVFDGKALENESEDALAMARRRIGFVFQSFQLLANLTARENILTPLELTGVKNAGERADRMIERVGLGERGHHYPSQLSGGEQQRVAIARAFAPGPQVLYADEPTGNLDIATGERVLEMLIELRREHGTTLVLVTHDPAVAARAERIITLSQGKIISDVRAPAVEA